MEMVSITFAKYVRYESFQILIILLFSSLAMAVINGIIFHVAIRCF